MSSAVLSFMLPEMVSAEASAVLSGRSLSFVWPAAARGAEWALSLLGQCAATSEFISEWALSLLGEGAATVGAPAAAASSGGQ
jgi:hypothetical protein